MSHQNPVLTVGSGVTWRTASYLSWFTGNGDAAILVVLDRCPSFLHQRPIACAGVKGRNASAAGTNPLCKRALQVSKQHPRSVRNPLHLDTEHSDTVPTL